MKTVKQISDLTGVTVRTLQYYDKINLLKPAKYSDAGYRLYDAQSLEKLQQILLFKELTFSLEDIKNIINLPDFDKNQVIDDQIKLLELKKARLEKLIALARGIKDLGGTNMDFTVFDKGKIEQYAEKAKAAWGDTTQYKDFENRSKKRAVKDEKLLHVQMMTLFKRLGEIKDEDPSSEGAQKLVGELKDFIDKNYYACSNETLLGLGKMYASDNEFTKNIDRAGGLGTAQFCFEAITAYCNH